MPEISTRSVLIVGAGPVGCALATLLRRQGLEVDVFERGSQSAGGDSGHSFNLTLTSRGLSCLPSSVERRLYRQGAVLTKRIIHHRDGAISTQPYGTTEAHHLLSIPRRVLQDLLRDQALREGARIHFERECLDVDTARPAVLVCDRNGRATWVEGLLVVGCDGSHSVVRDAVAAACPGHMRVTRRLIAHGHAEITMEYDGADPTGMHLWPRGDHFLQAQPNRDSTFTTSLFKPLEAGTRRPRFSALASAEAISDYCATEFADVFGLMSQVATDLTARPPGMLQVIRCAPYNHRRAVLVGDAAHVVVPFFGQGINCSFEDAATLARLLENLQFVTLNERGTAADIVTQETATYVSRPATRLPSCLSIISRSYRTMWTVRRFSPAEHWNDDYTRSTRSCIPRCTNWWLSPTCPTMRLSDATTNSVGCWTRFVRDETYSTNGTPSSTTL